MWNKKRRNFNYGRDGRGGRVGGRWPRGGRDQSQDSSVSSVGGEETIPSLQTLSLSATASGSRSVSSPYSTPRRADFDSNNGNVREQWEKEWAEFADSVNMTPPHRITRSVSDTIDIANDFLKTAGVVSVTWETLSNEQKAMMAFFVNEDLFRFFPEHYKAAKRIVAALFTIGDHGVVWHDNFLNFVRKGGDKAYYEDRESHEGEDGGVSRYKEHIEKYPIWKDLDERSVTLPNFHPLLRFQKEDAMVCSIVTACLLIDYSQKSRSFSGECSSSSCTVVKCDNGSGGTEATLAKFAMNISRFMRKELSQEEIYGYIFKSIGFKVKTILERIMLNCNRGRDVDDIIGQFDFDALESSTEDGDDVALDVFFADIHKVLAKGPLFTDRFRLYDEYGSSDTCVSGGGAKTFPKNDKFHSITIIGAARTPNQHGGILFLVQDSDPVHPFKNIGLNLMLQMGSIRHLGFLRPPVCFPTGGVFDLEPNFLFTFSGGRKKSLLCEERQVLTAEEQKAGLEAWYFYTCPDYVPPWKQRGGYKGT